MPRGGVLGTTAGQKGQRGARCALRCPSGIRARIIVCVTPAGKRKFRGNPAEMVAQTMVRSIVVFHSRCLRRVSESMTAPLRRGHVFEARWRKLRLYPSLSRVRQSHRALLGEVTCRTVEFGVHQPRIRLGNHNTRPGKNASSIVKAIITNRNGRVALHRYPIE